MAIGLAKGTNITFPIFHTRAGNSDVLVSSSYDRQPTRWQYSGVQLGDKDLELMKTLIAKIEPLASYDHDRVMNACIYFESGRLDHEYIRRFIMLVSVIESLFNSSTDHISETVAIRCASLISPDDAEEKIHYYRDLKDVYRMRSYLVHGQDLPRKFKTKKAQQTLIANAEFFARQSLLYIFKNNMESIFRLQNQSFNEYFAERALK